MNIQELINSTDLDMTEEQIKAFFIGVLCADRPLPCPKAIVELLSETPEAQKKLEQPLQELWNQLQKNLKTELNQLMPVVEDPRTYVEAAKDQLDFFLTGMALSGTNAENCDDEEFGEFIDELEELVEDMDDFLVDPDASEDDANDFKEFLSENWHKFAASKQ